MSLRACNMQGSRALATRPALPKRRIVQVGAQQLNAEVDKPLGLRLKASKSEGGGCVVASVGGNAAKAEHWRRVNLMSRLNEWWPGQLSASNHAPISQRPCTAGIKPGDTIIYTSSWFGDELWPADSPQFVNTALARAPSPVFITYVRGENSDINVKRLPKKPAPSRFGRKLTATQKERATHICVDCGYIYCDPLAFDETDPDYRCPQCKAPKKRFAKFDAETGKTIGGTAADLANLLTVVVGLAGVAVLAYLGLSL